jgi:uncharacterized protein YdaL
MRTRLFFALFLFFVLPLHAESFLPVHQPRVLILFDGPDKEGNPGRLDARYLANLLGHFTTRREIESVEVYVPGTYKRFDAVFCIIYRPKYTIPNAVLKDANEDDGTFTWIGNQVAQLDRLGTLRRHGIAFEKFTNQIKVNQVFYKGRVLAKGDQETNYLRILNPERAKVLAQAWGPGLPAGHKIPYIIQSGSFWVIVDSPFSYSSENDRYLALADILHDILGIQHAERHPAILRVEDLNAMSEPDELAQTIKVIHKYHIPFAFGFVPTYINPQERIELRMSEKPEIVSWLKTYVNEGGTPILHGFTHQYRGVTTDDYEFWDDLGDRPIRGDSEAFVARRLEEAIKESMGMGLYPVAWETPHYAASALDYRVMHRFFDTVFERRLAGNHLDSDQYFPYPIVDLYGQFVIPENLAYVPIDAPSSKPILAAADAAWVVRDGYGSFFFHPFMKPEILDEIISGIKQRGYTFIDVKSEFPNRVHADGRAIQTVSGKVELTGPGRYLNEVVMGVDGKEVKNVWQRVPATTSLDRQITLKPGETYAALRQDVAPPSWMDKLMEVAKGNLSVLHRRWETVFPGRTVHDPAKTTLLWNPRAKGPDAVDQDSFFSAMRCIGMDVEKVDPAHLTDDALGTFGLLVIPHAAAATLPQDTIHRILKAINGGITVVTDGESSLSEQMGLTLGDPFSVGSLTDHLFVSQETHWADRPSVPWVSSPSADQLTVYYSDQDLQRPLVVGGRLGEGRYLYFAPLFDPITGQGYGRFPSLPQLLVNEYGFSPLLRGRQAEAYFDPGYRQAVSIEVLAKMWRRFGIRAVHAAAWTFYDKYVYDYERLVRVCHQNGILVYAWFEWPEVSQKFWDHHPEWREKTALGTDAHVDWRYLMNFQDPQCLKEVLGDVKKFLAAYDWDGVDVGEFAFESLEGPNNPGVFTPFNRQARDEFRRLKGFDPQELFRQGSGHYWEDNDDDIKAFYDYRRDTNIRLMKTLLESLDKQRKVEKRPWEIVVTVLDTLQHPELADYLGIDIQRTVGLLKEFHATLQAEDPASDWILPPDRYRKLGEHYNRLNLPEPYLIDINVLPVHPITQRGFATPRPTGVELLQLWRAASSQTPRVCFYSESSVMEQDWELLPYAMAAEATVHKEGDNWIVNTPRTTLLELGRGPRQFTLDGQPWFAAEKGDVWIPPGEHTLSVTRAKHSIIDTAELQTRLLSITGELMGSQRITRGLEVEYQSPTRCALLFNKSPYKITLDGQAVKLPVSRGDDGYTVLAPPGQHRLRVVSESLGLYAVEFTSVVLASLIVLFGLASTGLLAFLFLFVMLHRRIRKLWRRFGFGSHEEASE